MRALIADADPARREALHAELNRHGYEIFECTTAQAPERARELDPLLVCLGGDGALEASRALAEQHRIVVLVGDVSPEEGSAAGATDVWQVSGDLDARIHFARLQAENVRVGGEFALLRQAVNQRGRASCSPTRGSRTIRSCTSTSRFWT